MSRRLPLLPTLIVAAAVAVMIGLGFWQIERAQWKEALLAQYATAQGLPEIGVQTGPMVGKTPLFRRVSGLCLEVVGWNPVAGENALGDTGYAFLASCRTGAEGPGMVVDAGWSANPRTRPRWTGGEVHGIAAPDRKARWRVVSATGLGGLEASAPPSPAMIPNNHRVYAVQWFLFAAIAAVIYGLALRGRWRKEESGR